MSVYVPFVFLFMLRPSAIDKPLVLVFFVCLHLSAWCGAFWMMYQAVRYERRVLRYVLLASIPFMFVWYSLVRIPLRRAFQGNSEFIR
jgi:hypothetical protein